MKNGFPINSKKTQNCHVRSKSPTFVCVVINYARYPYVYTVPGYLDIGRVYQTLMLDAMQGDTAQNILDVFRSFLSDEISNFNSRVYYSNPDYLRCSYLEGKLLA